MKIYKNILASVLLLTFSGNAQKPGEEILKKMYDKYKNGPCRIYSFSQRNTHYSNDSVKGKSEWHEVIAFPDKFRITFGNKEDHNYVLFRNDSVYRYKNEQLKTKVDSGILILILGGMYYRPFNDVVNRYKKAGFDLSKLGETKWNGKNVFIVGALQNDLTSNQVWVDKRSLVVERIIQKGSDGSVMDMWFETHQPWCNGFVETRVSFRRNGRLEQVEEYYNIKKEETFPSE